MNKKINKITKITCSSHIYIYIYIYIYREREIDDNFTNGMKRDYSETVWRKLFYFVIYIIKRKILFQTASVL
jgi:hypothetical protein